MTLTYANQNNTAFKEVAIIRHPRVGEYAFGFITSSVVLQIKAARELSGQTCQICEDEIEITVDGELFVACNECTFPVCRTCYEYERKEGAQACPQGKTRYKQIKGSPRVEGDEDEEGVDDLEHEFDYEDIDALGSTQGPGAIASAHGGSAGLTTRSDSFSQGLEIPLLTYGVEIAYNENAIIVPPFASHGNEVHPAPPGTTAPLHPRPMVPEKDIALYGYGSVAWKDHMEDWKKRAKLETSGGQTSGQ